MPTLQKSTFARGLLAFLEVLGIVVLAAGAQTWSQPSFADRNEAWGGSGWYYNPLFGAFTYIPASGLMWNPWGYGFYSPGRIFGPGGISPDWFRRVAPIATTAGTAANQENNGGNSQNDLRRT